MTFNKNLVYYWAIYKYKILIHVLKLILTQFTNHVIYLWAIKWNILFVNKNCTSSSIWYCFDSSCSSIPLSDILIVNLNIVHLPSSDVTDILPPKLSTIFFDIERPSPLPDLFNLLLCFSSIPNKLNNKIFNLIFK